MTWSTHSYNLLEKILDTITTTWVVQFPFILIQDPWLWELRTGLIEKMHTIVSPMSQDLKILLDYTKHLWKPHIFKVDVKPTKQQLELQSWEIVQDVWARQIIQRLALAPAGQIKIVLIEHIQRMSLEATNAFLKSFEEPLPGRLIIATTKNIDQVIDTIVSRAVVIRHQRTLNDSSTYIDAYLSKNKLNNNSMQESQEHIHTYQELEQHVLNSSMWYRIVQLRQDLWAIIDDQRLLELLMRRASDLWHHHLISRLSLASSMIKANVKSENVRFWLWV